MNSKTRLVRSGGLTKSQLLAKLHESGVELNAAAEALFAHENFVPCPTTESFETVELTVRELGFSTGATMREIVAAAAQMALVTCPLELAAHLRLHLTNQAEGHWGQPQTQHRAPPGSLTVVSPTLSDDDAVPKGFYLRKIKGVLWLRGYTSEASYRWEQDDWLVFCKRPNAA